MAAGAGVSLALACDIRIAAADVVFGIRETRMAMVADVGTLQRLPGIIGRGQVAELAFSGDDFGAERALALKLAQLAEITHDVLLDFRPNLLASYLYELADTYHSFYEACHVLRSEGTARNTRLTLCEATSRVLKTGLGLLGIQTTERM